MVFQSGIIAANHAGDQGFLALLFAVVSHISIYTVHISEQTFVEVCSLQFPHEKYTTMNIRGKLLLSLQNKVLYSNDT